MVSNETVPNWPIRVGGIYLLTGREPLALRVCELDGDTVHYIHHQTRAELLFEKGYEYGADAMPAYCFRAQCQPENQFLISDLLEALEALLEAIPKQTYADWWPDELTRAVRAARAAIAKAEVQS